MMRVHRRKGLGFQQRQPELPFYVTLLTRSNQPSLTFGKNSDYKIMHGTVKLIYKYKLNLSGFSREREAIGWGYK